MKNNDEVVSEVFRRGKEKKEQLARRKKLLMTCIPIALVVCVVLTASIWQTLGNPSSQVPGQPDDQSSYLRVYNQAWRNSYHPAYMEPGGVRVPDGLILVTQSQNKEQVLYDNGTCIAPAGAYSVRYFRTEYDGSFLENQQTRASDVSVPVCWVDSAQAAASLLPAELSYDEEFFREKTLLVLRLTESSGSIRHQVTSVRTDGTTLTAEVRRIVPQVGTADMTSWVILIEVEKTAPVISCTAVDAVSMETEPGFTQFPDEKSTGA